MKDIKFRGLTKKGIMVFGSLVIKTQTETAYKNMDCIRKLLGR